jgi:hypothetical protein
MHESIPTLFGPVGDDRYTACLDQCELNLSRCPYNSSVPTADPCDRTYRDCIESCEHREGVVRV